MPDTSVTTLQLSFKNASGGTVSMSFRYPQAEVTSEDIDTVMALIIAKNIISSPGGALISAYDGGIVTRSFVDMVE
jgi:hypothetical protein